MPNFTEKTVAPTAFAITIGEFYSPIRTVPRPSPRLRDWLFGSTAKRLLIATFLAEPDRLWTKYALAKQVSVHVHGGVDEHLAALKQIGFIRTRGGRWQLAPRSRLEAPLRALLDAVERLPDRPVRKP